MTIVTSYVEHPASGKPARGVAVTVRIIAFPVPWLADSTGKVLGTSTGWTGPDGYWRLDLKPHTEFEDPEHTYAEIVEHSNDPAKAITYYAQVPPPDPGNPTKAVLLRDILVPRPDENLGQPPWTPIDRLVRLRDVDADSIRQAKPGDVLMLLATGKWGAGRLLPLTLFWEAKPGDLLTIQYRVTGFGGGGARVGFGDGTAEIVVSTEDVHTHTYAGPGTYIMTAVDVNSPGFNTKQTVTVKDHLPRAFAYLDGDDDWRVLLWLDEPLDNTKYAISWGDGSPIEEHIGQRLPKVPPRPRVAHQYTRIGRWELVVTDLASKRKTTREIETGEIGVLITYDEPNRPRVDALWMATGATWEMQRDGFPPASGIVPASGRVSHLGPVVEDGDYRFEVREIIAGQVRRTSVRRRVQPSQWDWRMDVAISWRSQTDPLGKQTVTVTAKGARTRCTVEWGDGSAAGVVDPGQPISHVYTLPAPAAGWRLRLIETQIADPRTWTRVLGEPRYVGTPVLNARTNGAVDLDVAGIDQLYNDDWRTVTWGDGSDPDPVGSIGFWFPANHVFARPGHYTVRVDGPGQAAPIDRDVDVVFYPSPAVTITEAVDAEGKIIDPDRRTAQIAVDNSASGGPCTVRAGDGSAPRPCKEIDTFQHVYGKPSDPPATFYVIATSDADQTAKGRLPVRIPFGAARTLFCEITGAAGAFTITLTVTAHTPGKTVEVQWDNGGTWQTVPPSNQVQHSYPELPDDMVYTVTARYQGETGAETWTSPVTIPFPGLVVMV